MIVELRDFLENTEPWLPITGQFCKTCGAKRFRDTYFERFSKLRLFYEAVAHRHFPVEDSVTIIGDISARVTMKGTLT